MLINTSTVELPDAPSASAPEARLANRSYTAPVLPAASAPVNAKNWCKPAVIERDQLTSDLAPQVAVNARGEAFAIWRQLEDGRSRLWVNRCERGQGWGVAQTVDGGAAQSLGYPQIGVDAEGNALAVWRQQSAKGSEIWAAQYTAGAHWGPPVCVSAAKASTEIFAPQLCVDASGNALAVWQMSVGNSNGIYAAALTHGKDWATPVLVSNGNVSDASAVQIAMGAGAHAVAVWRQVNEGSTTVWASRCTPQDGWGAAQPLGVSLTGTALHPQIAVNDAGTAFAIWTQVHRGRCGVWVSSAGLDADWALPRPIDMGRGNAVGAVDIVADAQGNATAVWEHSDGERFKIAASRCMVGLGWTRARMIDALNVGDARSPKIAVGADGNAIAVWQQLHDASRAVWTSRYSVGLGWGAPQPIPAGHAGDAFDPQIAMDAAGSAVVVWQQLCGPRFAMCANIYR